MKGWAGESGGQNRWSFIATTWGKGGYLRDLWGFVGKCIASESEWHEQSKYNECHYHDNDDDDDDEGKETFHCFNTTVNI